MDAPTPAVATTHPIDAAAAVLGVSLERFGLLLGVTKSAVSQGEQPGDRAFN